MPEKGSQSATSHLSGLTFFLPSVRREIQLNFIFRVECSSSTRLAVKFAQYINKLEIVLSFIQHRHVAFMCSE